MNIHVPDEIRKKYSHIEFRGLVHERKGRRMIKCINHTTNQHFWYSFDEDFFWFRDSDILDWIIN